MRPALAASAAAAALVHAFVLFGLDLDRAAAPLPETLAPIVVSLVAAAPASTGAAPSAAAPPLAPAAPPEPPLVEKPHAKRPRSPAPTRARVEPKPAPREAVTKPSPAVTPAVEGATTGESVQGTPGAPPGAAPGGTQGATQVAATPRYRMTPAPEYPASARRLRQEGVVLLAVDVSADGRPTSVAVARSSGVASLDDAAVRGVRRWRFDPARTAGLPVASRVEVPIRFSLTD